MEVKYTNVRTSTRSYFNYLVKIKKPFLLIRKFIFWILSKQFKGLVLDVGCGTGLFLEVYHNAVGCDNNKYCLNHCIAKGHKVFYINLEKDEIKQRFNGIFCSSVLEHLKKYTKVLNNLDKILEPKGKAIFIVPNKIGLADDPTHNLDFDWKDVAIWLKNNSYKLKIFNLLLLPLPLKFNDVIIVAEKLV